MGRIFGIALLVVALYFAATTYVGKRGGDPEGSAQSTAQRAGAKVEAAMREGAARREALLEE